MKLIISGECGSETAEVIIEEMPLGTKIKVRIDFGIEIRCVLVEKEDLLRLVRCLNA